MYSDCLVVLGVFTLIGLTSTSAGAKPGTRAQEKPVLNYINPSPNPLQIPTLPKSVQIRGTQPITLQQAQELARRNNQLLQIDQLTFERSLAGQREQQASVYPTLGVSAESAHFSSH